MNTPENQPVSQAAMEAGKVIQDMAVKLCEFQREHPLSIGKGIAGAHVLIQKAITQETAALREKLSETQAALESKNSLLVGTEGERDDARDEAAALEAQLDAISAILEPTFDPDVTDVAGRVRDHISSLRADLAAQSAKLSEAETALADAQQWIDSEPEWKAAFLTNRAEIIKAFREYLAFLDKANEGQILNATIHGWKCPQSDIEEGERHRAKIAALTQ